ncbi:MAG: hypothetical protein ACJ0K4_04440 [Verrucomicrobiales bacterium]
MSEENPQTPTPEDKSSSVPLKKETTRVTLKASEGAAPPPPAPAAPKAPAQATQPLALLQLLLQLLLNLLELKLFH